MADYDLKSITPATTVTDGTTIFFGAEGQSATPQPYTSGGVWTWIVAKITANAAAVKTALSLVKGDVGLGNVANSLQLVAASNLSDVTDTDATRLNIGLGFAALRKRFYAATDFIVGLSTLISPDWVISTSGTGSGTFSQGSSPTNNTFGVLSLETGTTTTGRCSCGSSNATGTGLLLGMGRARFQSKFTLHVLSNGTDTYTARYGFIDSFTAESTDGVFFRYTDSVNSGKWQAVCRSNNVETTADTGITPVADTWHLMTIDVNAAGSSVSFSIDGSVVATITTNIPTGSGRDTGYGGFILKSAGTTNASTYNDFMEVQVDFTTQR